MPPVTERSPATTLQGFELVVHVFVAADGTPADRRFVEDLWHGCVAEFALDDAIASYPRTGRPPCPLPARARPSSLCAPAPMSTRRRRAGCTMSCASR